MKYSVSKNGKGFIISDVVDALVPPAYVFVPSSAITSYSYDKPNFPSEYLALLNKEVLKRKEQADQIRKEQEKNRLDLQKETSPPKDEQIDMFGDFTEKKPYSPYTPGAKIAKSNNWYKISNKFDLKKT